MRTVFAPLACFLAALLLAAPLFAAEVDPTVPIDRLQLEIKPQTQEKLQAVVKDWFAALRETVKQASETRLALSDAPAEEQQQLKDRLGELAEQRERVVARLAVVLSHFEAKGGDGKEERQYINAIGDGQEDIVEAKGGWVNYIWDWVKSPDGGIRWAKNIGFFLLIVIGFRIVANIVGSIVRRSLDRMGRTPQLLRNFLANTTRNIIFLIGLVVALSQLGVDVGPMLAAIGGAGFVIAFALQSTLSNFAAGVMILLYRPFEIGDFVQVSGVKGKVQAMTLVSTTILTPDNQVIIVPNSNIWGDVITNVTGSSTRRVDLVFGIGYDDDMAHAQRILEELASSHPKVLKEPEPVVKVGTLNSSSVDFLVRPWCNTGDYWDVYWDLTRQVKERFDAEGISIPYPQTDIHVHQVAPAAMEKQDKQEA